MSLTWKMSSPDNVCLGKKPRTEASAWSFTATKDSEFSFAWTIENFSRKMEAYNHGKNLESGIFKIRLEGLETSWKLSCYPNGLKEDDKGAVSFYLLCTDTTPLKTFKRQLRYSLVLVNEEGSGMFKRNIERCCTNDSWANGWGWFKFVTHEQLRSDQRKLIPKDSLEVFCVIKFDGPEVTVSGASSPANIPLKQKEEEKAGACSGLVDMLKSGVLSDVELVCEGRAFSCHKVILASKSPVFMATFCNIMKEKTTGQINIEGINADIVKDMLTHVYGGNIEKLEDKADELLVVADRYDLKQLKQSCEEMLAIGLNITNCLDCLIIADRHSSDFLKPAVIRFILENFLEVVALDNWMEKLINFSELFQEVFDELASFRSSKDEKQANKNEKTD